VREGRRSGLRALRLGRTEKNLAAAFEEARERRALLLLDEVDSLVSSRRSATRSHEVSQVNELLVQFESWRGWLVCTTNFCGGLHEAARDRRSRPRAPDAPHARRRAAVVEQVRILGGIETGLALAERLEREASYKRGENKKVGCG
jgi:hypothetical protein